jgi:hypothetical protein
MTRKDDRTVYTRESIGETCKRCGGRIKAGETLRQLVSGVEHVNVNDCRDTQTD